jgi:hypothetical protein
MKLRNPKVPEVPPIQQKATVTVPTVIPNIDKNPKVRSYLKCGKAYPHAVYRCACIEVGRRRLTLSDA